MIAVENLKKVYRCGGHILYKYTKEGDEKRIKKKNQL
jgi:hypothetical protein